MNWTEATALVNSKQNMIILTHVSPDGDAYGTLLGLGHALREQGKQVTVAVDGGLLDPFRFIPGSAAIRKELNGVTADLVIAVDCGDESRMGEVGKQARLLKTPLINLDHHWSNTNFGDVNLIDSEWVSASEGVLHWLDAMQIAISPQTAMCLLTGLVTDTICFRTANTKASTLGHAQRLIGCGADLSSIVQKTVSRMATSTIHLWAKVMPTVQIEDHVIWVKVDRAAKLAAGSANGGSGDAKDGGLSSLLVQADDAYISCVMHEKDDNKVELSFRGVPGFDTSKVAVAIGGGGHKLASGATVSGTLAEVEARVIPMLKTAVREGSPLS